MNHPRAGVLPPAFPRPFTTGRIRRPLARIGHVPDGRVEPDVDALVGGISVFHGNGHAPVRITGDAARAQVVDPAVGDALHVGAPFGVPVEPGLQAFRETGQIQEPVPGLTQHGRRGIPGDIGAGRQQFLGGILGAAGLAFIAIGIRVPALGAGTLDITVGQEPFRGSTRVPRIPCE